MSFVNNGKSELNSEAATKGLARMDSYIQAALSGMLANPAWNSVESQKYLRAKGLTLEQLAVAAGMECIIQLDKFLKGEVGGEGPSTPETQLELVPEGE